MQRGANGIFRGSWRSSISALWENLSSLSNFAFASELKADSVARFENKIEDLPDIKILMQGGGL